MLTFLFGIQLLMFLFVSVSIDLSVAESVDLSVAESVDLSVEVISPIMLTRRMKHESAPEILKCVN